MARFIVGHRIPGARGAAATRDNLAAARDALDPVVNTLSRDFNVRHDTASTGAPRRLVHVEGEASDMERLLREGVPGNVVVEPELKRELSWSYPLPLELVLKAQGSDPPPTGFGRTLNLGDFRKRICLFRRLTLG